MYTSLMDEYCGEGFPLFCPTEAGRHCVHRVLGGIRHANRINALVIY